MEKMSTLAAVLEILMQENRDERQEAWRRFRDGEITRDNLYTFLDDNAEAYTALKIEFEHVK